MAKQPDYPPPLQQDELRRLIATAQGGSGKRASEASSKACLHNMRLVCQMARWFASRALTMDDLIQEGYVVLTRCVKNFDLTMMNNSGTPVRFSTYATRSLKHGFCVLQRAAAKRAKHELFDVDGDEWHPAWSIDEYDRPAECVSQYRTVLPSVMRQVLTERERRILDMRVRGTTMEEVGAVCSISKERVRQLQARALKKLALALGHYGKTNSL